MIIKFLGRILCEVEGVVDLDIRWELSQLGHGHLAQEVFLNRQWFLLVEYVTVNLSKVLLNFFLRQFTVSPEQLQIEITLIKLTHRKDWAFIDVFDAETSQLLLLVDGVFFQELGKYFLGEFTPQLREVIAGGNVVEVCIYLLQSHSRYGKYVIVHYVYLNLINKSSISTLKLNSSRESVFMNSSLELPYWASISFGVRYWILIMLAKKFDKKSGYSFDANLLCYVVSFNSTR